MITNFKLFEKVDHYLLCIKEPHRDYHYKFTKGHYYKIYNSNIGSRLKDKNNNFVYINVWNKEEFDDITVFNYADGIFTTAKSIEEYEIKINVEKYNL